MKNVFTYFRGKTSRRVVAVLAGIVAFACVANTSRVDVPPTMHIDLESFAEAPMPQAGPMDRNLKITLALGNAAATNNAEIEIGETVFGWDCGEWFVLGDRQRERVATAGGGPGQCSLTVRIQVSASNTVGRVSFHADGKVLSFPGLEPEILASWLGPATSGTLRVTSRGGAVNVSASADWSAYGTLMILR